MIFETVQKSNDKFVSKEVPEYDYQFTKLHIEGPYSDTRGYFFINFVLNFCQLYE